MTNREFLDTCVKLAREAGHIYPEMAACEAALESNWGKSKLAKEANNLFGRKQSIRPVYETYSIKTKEYIGKAWHIVEAKWVKYPDLKTCFKDRMELLQRLRGTYVEYDKALKATTPEDFIHWVSSRWATDPERGEKCLSIYKKYFGGK